MGKDPSAKRDCRIFCGEMRCFRSTSGGVARWTTCFRKMSGGLWIRNKQHRLHTRFFWSTGPQSACGPPWVSKGGRFLHGNRQKRADNSRKHRQCRGARLHLDIQHRRRAHNTHKNIQQSSIDFRGRRNPRTCWWPSGRIRRLSQPTSSPNLPTPGRASSRMYTPRSLCVCMPAKRTSNKKATDCIEKVLEQVSNEDEEDGIFVVQPPSKQWKNLAESVDRYLVLADRPQGHIFVGWFAHTKTGRIAGIHVHPTAANVRDEAKWEKAILWAAGDFGFRNCPIFRVDILSADKEGVELGPLRCYTKDGNARTILASSKKPTQLHPNGGDLSTLLPPTDKIVWEWRDKKCHAIGKASSKYKLQEIQEIAEQRKISALSTKNREKALAELRYASTVEEWKREKWQREEKQRKKEEENTKAREAEIANLRK